MHHDIDLSHTAAVIANCWQKAEAATRGAIRRVHWAPSEEEVTFLLRGELRRSIAAATKGGAFGTALVDDISPHLVDSSDSSSLRSLSRGLIGSVHFHTRTQEGKRSAADLALIIRRPRVSIVSNPTSHTVRLTEGKNQALLLQAKMRRGPAGWGSLTANQRRILANGVENHCLLLYDLQDKEGRRLAPFRWQPCKGAELRRIDAWLRQGNFPDEAESHDLIRRLALGNIGTDEEEWIQTVACPPGSTTRVLEIRVGWREDAAPPVLRVPIRQSVQVAVSLHR